MLYGAVAIHGNDCRTAERVTGDSDLTVAALLWSFARWHGGHRSWSRNQVPEEDAFHEKVFPWGARRHNFATSYL